jgi:long-chain acyl-CoA synthetase
VGEGRTIGRLWRDAIAAGHPEPAYLAESQNGWTPVTWAQAAEHVDELANGLLALGIEKGDAFGMLCSTRLEWALFDFALARIGAITAPSYTSSSPRDCAYVLGHSESVGVLVEDDEQAAKIERVRGELPAVRHVLAVAELDELRARGRDFARHRPDALAEAEAAVGDDDLYTYIYTSGTTGPPKACMIRHRNYYAMASVIDRLENFIVSGDRLLLYLPLAHNFGRLMHLVGPYAGFTVAFCADPYRVAEALPEVKPTVFPSVPRLFEKTHTAVTSALQEAHGVKRWLGRWALRTGHGASELLEAGERLPATLAFQRRLADRLVYSKVKARLGGRLRAGISGGAPLAKEIAEFFHAIDILILEGYGLTECTSAATVNRMDRYRFGSVGLALPGTELRLADDGEILIRTDTLFAGYLKDEQATRETVTDDRWLKTGDLGQIDAAGFLRVTDRKKDILVTAGGKKIAPQNLENELKGSRFVSQALVVGDRRPYVAALITLDEQQVAKWRAGGGKDVQALIQGVVDDVNDDYSRFEQIKRFAILPRDFSAEEGEVTPTLKLKRRVCEEHFAAEIDALYAAT